VSRIRKAPPVVAKAEFPAPPICMRCDAPGKLEKIEAVFTSSSGMRDERVFHVCFRCSLTYRYTNSEHRTKFQRKCRASDNYWRCWCILSDLSYRLGGRPPHPHNHQFQFEEVAA
jgi:hypothetical protein